MTGSWAMDVFIIGCIILVVIPAAVCVYEDILKYERGDFK